MRNWTLIKKKNSKQIKDAEFHSTAALRQRSDPKTNKDIKVRAFESPMSFCGLYCRKKSYSRFLRPTKLKDGKKYLRTYIFCQPNLKTNLKMSNKKSARPNADNSISCIWNFTMSCLSNICRMYIKTCAACSWPVFVSIHNAGMIRLL